MERVDFDRVDANAPTHVLERATLTGEIASDDPHLLHRRLFDRAMTAQGLVNYPKKFWYYDCGPRMAQSNRAKFFGAPLETAWYGDTPLPPGLAHDPE